MINGDTIDNDLFASKSQHTIEKNEAALTSQSYFFPDCLQTQVWSIFESYIGLPTPMTNVVMLTEPPVQMQLC